MDTHHSLRLTMTTDGHSRHAALRGLGGAGVATALGLVTSHPARASQTHPKAMLEPEAGTWRTWVLTSGGQFRPEASPDEAATEAELAELQEIAADRDAAALDRIAHWDAGSPGYRWNEIAMHQAAAGTRLEAYPSDTAAGLALGQEVGRLFFEYARADGSDAVYDIAKMPSWVGLWTGTPATSR